MPGSAGQPGLSRDRIVAVALELVEAEGLEGLTMRRLAGKLGVAATAIYWHVGDKEALLDALSERIAARVGDIPVAGTGPVERVVSIGAGLRRNLLEQPTLVGLVHQQGHTALLFQPVRRALVQELTAAGLRGASTALALNVILSHISGSVLNDVQLARSPEQHETPEELWEADDVPDDPELLDALARPIDRDELFDYSLTELVGALIGYP
jgi:TetR/AcrR family transcriptional regulator, tetracycline repressor protein